MESLLEKYADEIGQAGQFLELATEVKDDLRSTDYFKIGVSYLAKASTIIDEMEDMKPSAINAWKKMRQVIQAYHALINNAYEWQQFIRSPAFDISNPAHNSKYKRFVKKNRSLAIQTTKLEQQAIKLLKPLVETG